MNYYNIKVHLCQANTATCFIGVLTAESEKIFCVQRLAPHIIYGGTMPLSSVTIHVKYNVQNLSLIVRLQANKFYLRTNQKTVEFLVAATIIIITTMEVLI
jgi:hypothetical protein